MSKSNSTPDVELLANSFLNYAGALIVVLDKEGRIVQFNRASEELSGLTFDEVKGKFPWDTVLPPEDAETIRVNAFETLARNPQALSGSYTNYWVTKNDGRALIKWVNSLVLDDQGKMSYMTSIGVDITERRLNEKKLESSEARLKEAQRLAKIGSWELDLIDNTLVWSDEIFNIFEIDQAQFGASYEAFLDGIHPDDRDRVNRAYSDSLINQSPYEIVHRLQMKDGSIKFVRETCESFFDTEGKPLRSVGTVQDITELHKVEDELKRHRDHLEEIVEERTAEMKAARDEAERANLAKSEFLSRMSHELRTPMNAILGFGQILEMNSDELNDNQRNSVKSILEAGSHLLGLINEMLDLAKIEAGKMEVSLAEIPVENVLNQCVSLISTDAKLRHLNIVDNVSNKGYTIQADFNRSKQVLLNILSNAMKYNRDYGSITLNCEIINKQYLRICITDTGIGLSKDEIAKLFTSFERLNTNVNVEGAGIGLVISKSLIELMGGNIGVESVPGEGSTFWVEFLLPNT
ncbi:MAG: PAS domain S-box protein [Gammaproteobacteria bacterium]|nr:PAS domain S-box protein [Gammaproteobacteria bacterium]